MKKVESSIEVLVALLFSATALWALFVVGALVFKGPAATRLIHSPDTTAAPAAAEAAAPASEGVRAAAEATAVATAVQTAAQTAVEAPAATEAPAPAAETAPASGNGGADLAAGAKAFGQCKACHTVTKGGKNGTGPNLWGIVGASAAAVEGFKYSDGMKAMAGKVWDAALIDRFIEKPKEVVPGTKMAYAGMRKPADRSNLIAWLAQQSDTPQTVAAAPAAEQPAADQPADQAAADVPADAAPATLSQDEIDAIQASLAWMNPPARTAEDKAAAEARAAAIAAALPGMDYEAARFHPLHFPPASLAASNEECLVCHEEILTHKPRAASPAGVSADATLAWYQTLDTYEGAQESFHFRHLKSDFARLTMNLECSFCHKGNDPREETPDMVVGRDAHTASATPEFTLRKMVNPSTTCLMCHGAFPSEVMGLEGPWHKLREDLETEPGTNGCLSCHGETFRTNRHLVDFLNAGNIEALARVGSSDSCHGCHGGRKWYRNSFPYPRNPWPGMDAEVPDWAAGRPTASDPAHAFTPVKPAE